MAKALEQITDGAVDICFISTKKGLQTTLVPNAGYELFMFDMIGLKGLSSCCGFPPQLVRAGWGASRVIKDHGIDVVVGMGVSVGAGDGGGAVGQGPFTDPREQRIRAEPTPSSPG